ncbi:MAG: ROK family protein [Crocinitomicaceae bacterium]|nr:ROK family protein [Crocinitomicaceae bacterium]
MASVVLGIDIGGTNIEYGLITKEGENLYSSFLKTESIESIEELAQNLKEEISPILKKEKYKLHGIGIGAPKGNYLTGCIEFAANLPWKGVVEINPIFEEVFGVATILTNDANAAAYGEKMYGVAKEMKNFMVITLGTGIGTGFFMNGQLQHGSHGNAGEMGHITIDPLGRECGCGRLGCLERYASATGIALSAREKIEFYKGSSSLSKIAPSDITAKNITIAAKKGDPLALELFDDTSKILGKALANITTVLDLEAFVFAGGLAKAKRIITEPTKRYMDENLMEDFKSKVQIVCSSLLAENSAIFGAAALYWNEEKGNS